MVARRQVVELGALPEWLSVSHPGLGGLVVETGLAGVARFAGP